VVSRAVTTLPDFVKWVDKKIKKENRHELKNGILYLKGGDLETELAPFRNRCRVYDLSSYFDEPFFETKKVVHLGL
jgi:16S rRNA (guanine527-N7)-methyltransferase